jgi:hypothetical protein
MTKAAVVLLGLVGCARVHNGTVVDVADVPLAGATKVHVPGSAVVTQAGPPGVMRVEMTKRLGFGGHPPRSMSIAAGRRLMGVATRRSGEVLEMATFGDFETKEGGATIKLRVRVPVGVDVEKKAELEGDASPARGTGSGRDDPETYWYASPEPAAGWTPFVGK